MYYFNSNKNPEDLKNIFGMDKEEYTYKNKRTVYVMKSQTGKTKLEIEIFGQEHNGKTSAIYLTTANHYPVNHNVIKLFIELIFSQYVIEGDKNAK